MVLGAGLSLGLIVGGGGGGGSKELGGHLDHTPRPWSNPDGVILIRLKGQLIRNHLADQKLPLMFINQSRRPILLKNPQTGFQSGIVDWQHERVAQTSRKKKNFLQKNCSKREPLPSFYLSVWKLRLL